MTAILLFIKASPVFFQKMLFELFPLNKKGMTKQ